jgi:hypothetical protein
VTGYVIYRNGQRFATAAGDVFGARVPRDGSYAVAAVDAEGNEGAASSPVLA